MKKDAVLKIEMCNITIKAIMHGFWHGENQPSSRMHNHATFEFHMLMRGNAIMETEGETIELNEKDFIVIPPEKFHCYKYLEKGSAVLSFAFFIEKNGRKSNIDYGRLVDEKLKNVGHLIHFSRNLQIEESLTKIVASVYTKTLVVEEQMKAHFILLFSEIFLLIDDRKSTINDSESDLAENDARIFMIEEYFNEYYTENISLKNLADRLYLSEKQTDAMIKRAFGEGFRQHLSRIRLHTARKLLKNTDMEVKEIAETVGYRSYNGFYLAFKEKMGVTPLKYREKQKNGIG